MTGVRSNVIMIHMVVVESIRAFPPTELLHGSDPLKSAPSTNWHEPEMDPDRTNNPGIHCHPLRDGKDGDAVV